MTSAAHPTATAAAHPTVSSAAHLAVTSAAHPTAISAARGTGAPRGPVQASRSARSDSRREDSVAKTAVGSYPQWAMQLAHRGSRPRP